MHRARLLFSLGYVDNVHCVDMVAPCVERQPYLACRDGDLEMIALFAEHGFDFNQKLPEHLTTCLMDAAEAGNADVVRTLVECHNVSVHLRDVGGATALICAAFTANLETIRELVSLGSDINAVDDRNRTPVAKAIEFHRGAEVRRFLHSAGARCDILPTMGSLAATAVRVQLKRPETGPLGDWLTWQHDCHLI